MPILCNSCYVEISVFLLVIHARTPDDRKKRAGE